MKSRAAYLQSCWCLRDYAKATGSKLYFWTFTTKEVLPDWRLSPIWRRFIRDVSDMYRHDDFPLVGIRVLERHKKGNLHYHAIVTKRIPVDEVRKIGSKYGIGRVHVRKVRDEESIMYYLAKYLGKQRVRGIGTRIKTWGTIGPDCFGVKRSEIIFEHRGTLLLKRVKAELFPDGGVGYRLACQIMNWKWAGFPDKEDFLLHYARENWGKPWDRFFPLTACDEWMIANMYPIWGGGMDGKIPF